MESTIGARYRLVPPEGGWGYFITMSVLFINLIQLVQKSTFGLLFGDFLTSIGDATKISSLTIGLFTTMMSFTGILASFLLRKYSYRKVCFLGAVIYLSGAIGLIFVRSEWEMYFYFSILQGIGCGLTYPSCFTALNFYFDKKLNFQVGIARVLMVVFNIGFPHFITFLIKTIGFRSAAAIVAVAACINFPAAWVLHPVKWHMKKELIPEEIADRKISIDKCDDYMEVKTPFLNNGVADENHVKRKHSLHSISDSTLAIGPVEKRTNKLLDFSLFKNIRFLNVSTGLSLAFTSDVSFYSMIPLLLKSANFEVDDQATMTTVFFVCDLVSRVIFSISCLFFTIRNRYLYLGGAFVSAIFRIAFTLRDDYLWRIITLGFLGFFRTYIQVPFSLVISDEYKDNFATAFSLTMFVCGVINLIVGPLMSYIKTTTQSDVMVAHVLTVAFLICTFTWTIELTYDWLTKNNKASTKQKK